MSKATYRDAFNLLCGTLLGEGIHRKVFECRLRPDLVVKVEKDIEWRCFANVAEQRFWDDAGTKEALWLAPCVYLSPDGRILMQRRVAPVAPDDVLPQTVPAFLTDMKRSNFGWLPDADPQKPRRLVCVDYAAVISAPSLRMKPAAWRD